ncbi:Alpha/Beta hydrolase protein [Phaeosphaeriaceae sp. PMI808]|nr:Alpha/Beta hydrolase protein [Phaeosphaeriaceae sp. PMI808]
MSSQPVLYTIFIPDSAIKKLKRKLSDADYPDELDTVDQWPYGSPLADVRRLANHWEKKFDWRRAESKLNDPPNHQKSVNIEEFGDINVHFVSKLLPLLDTGEKNGKPAFHIVAPSLPNLGFSQRITKPGFALSRYAETCHHLMQNFSYENYGLYITRIMGILYQNHMLASHINMVRAHPLTFASQPALALQHAVTSYTEVESKGIQRSEWFTEQGQGPVALLAWIYEKLVDWTDEYSWTDDEILTWVGIYWFGTAGPSAPIRIYCEAQNNPTDKIPNRDHASQWVESVKLELAHFPRELTIVPRIWGKTLGGDNERGGHFAAWERPDVIVNELQNMLEKGGKRYKFVPAKSGH